MLRAVRVALASAALAAAACALAALCSAPAGARAWDSYRNLIPNGHNVQDEDGNVWPGVGHGRTFGGGPTNPFGRDFAKANTKWLPDLCRMDSDGDGRTNGQELGDPECVWTPGAQPKFACTSHPGFKNDPDTFCHGNSRFPAPRVSPDL